MSGNGADLGAIYQAILAVAADLRSFRAEVRTEFRNVRAEMADLRQMVADIHGAVIGHGVLISGLDECVRRLERRREPPEIAG